MKKLFMVMIVFAAFISQSCVSRYVGKRVNMAAPGICSCYTLPKKCQAANDQFQISWTLKKDETGKYKVEGSAKYIGSGPWATYEGVLFMLLLIDKGQIVESLSVPGGQGTINKTIIFEREFTPKHEFTATTLSYRMTVRG